MESLPSEDTQYYSVYLWDCTLGQLNTYVAYYKKHQMTSGDQPPIGILLCTRKNDALVEYALGDLSNKVFVSRYAVELPKKEEMVRFIAQLTQEAGQ